MSQNIRIKDCFENLKKEKRGAFLTYIEAFDPDPQTSLSLLNGMPQAGADIIEVGMPFSDPGADGPTIQKASERGLKAGATLMGTLNIIKEFRKNNTTTPIILMGYLNPIEHFGIAKFCDLAENCGVDGLIIVDMPYEEKEIISQDAEKHHLDLITLVTPVTPNDRLKKILKTASGFIYYVSITGITGTNTASRDELTLAMKRLRKVTTVPIITGFGIKTPQQAAIASQISDGAVVASALIKIMEDTLKDGKATRETVPTVLKHVSEIAKAVRKTA